MLLWTPTMSEAEVAAAVAALPPPSGEAAGGARSWAQRALHAVWPQARLSPLAKLGKGLSRNVFAAEVQPPGLVAVVLLPRREARPQEDYRAMREAMLLRDLSRRELPFRVPKVFAIYCEQGRLAQVREFVRGEPGQEAVGRIAASLHGLGNLPDCLSGPPSCREYGLSFLERDLQGYPEALEWARAHPPPDEPTCLIHGDLLAQNILGPEPTVIDWERARLGDPAHELAIAAYGQPLEPFLESYGRPMSAERVRYYQLCMAACFRDQERLRQLL